MLGRLIVKCVILCSSFAIGGAESMVAQLLSNIDKTDLDIVVVTSNPKQNNHIQQMVDNANVRCYYTSDSNNKRVIEKMKILFRISRILNTEKPDIIHSNLSIVAYSFPYILFHKTKLLHTAHTLPEKDLGYASRLMLKFLRRLNKASFTSISHSIQERIINIYGVYEADAPVIENPVDCQMFYCKRNTESNANASVRFINVGRLTYPKNQHLLIKAFAEVVSKYPKVSLSIIGDGELRENLDTTVTTLGLNSSVKLLGKRNDIPHLLRNADIFVLSSRYEGLPLTVLEAMASGLPIISTAVGGVPDVVVENKNGFLVPNEDEQSLATAMIKLIDDYQQRVTMGNNSIELAKKYDVKSFAQKYRELYFKIANE